MEHSKIEWTDHTFNPWIGCTNVSEGCDNCYAEALAKRYGWVRWGKGQTRHLTSDENWKKPLSWDREASRARVRRRVFCASLADVMDLEAPHEWRARLWDLIRLTPNLDWLLLSKRPQHYKRFLPWEKEGAEPWHNVWIGATAENQKRFNERVKILANTSAAVRFLSLEPLLGPIDIHLAKSGAREYVASIDWAIIGGESGPQAREFKSAWMAEIISECRKVGVAVFVKQMGRRHDLPNRLTSRKGGDMAEWPRRFRIRELPAEPS